MNAKTLFEQGVIAIRDEKDMAKGRELLMQSLKLEPHNEMGWLWLSRTTNEPHKKIQCLERALKINPNNQQTKMLIAKLRGDVPAAQTINRPEPPKTEQKSTTPTLKTSTQDAKPVFMSSGTTAVAAGSSLAELRMSEPDEEEPAFEEFEDAPAAAAPPPKISANEETQIKQYLEKGQALLDKNDLEGAIEQWVRVLEIEVDHELALANAVRYLSRLKYIEDARELVWNAIKAGTRHPSVYLTAIDIAKYQGNMGEADDLRMKLVQLPEAGEKNVLSVAEYFNENAPHKALEALDLAAPHYPKSQKIALRRAQLADELGMKAEAVKYYEIVARFGTRTREGKEADKKLSKVKPQVTDRERGSVGLAVREAFGVGVLFLLVGFQDAGLNLLLLGPGRIAGIVLSILGGYLLVTATSSPQQQPLAKMMGGQVPEPRKEKPKREDYDDEFLDLESPTELPIIPTAVRITFGLIGTALIIGALALVFSTTITILRNPEPPSFYIPTLNDLMNEQ